MRIILEERRLVAVMTGTWDREENRSKHEEDRQAFQTLK
jgi:hypothetical protein